MQRPDATLVTGYRNWQSMGRQVMKGEKGITIIAPAPVKKKQKQEVLDRDHRPVLDENGVPVLKEVEIKIPRFKAITVFDIAQTTGEPIELLAPQELQEAVRDYDFILQALKDISPVPIRFDEIEGTSKGYYKDILSITVGANETSKFWLGMLNDLKNRGVQDVLFFCVDGLPGFKDAIQAVFPQAQIQRCVIHMLRNSFKYVNYNDLKKFSADFKAVYNAPNESAALSELETIKEKWGKKYPYAISNWENNWEDVSSFFQFSEDIRRIMYTTNIIEGLNRQYRKVTKTKSVFPSDTALEKMLFLASRNVTKKWTQRYRNWDQVLNQLIILYDERLTAYL